MLNIPPNSSRQFYDTHTALYSPIYPRGVGNDTQHERPLFGPGSEVKTSRFPSRSFDGTEGSRNPGTYQRRFHTVFMVTHVGVGNFQSLFDSTTYVATRWAIRVYDKLHHLPPTSLEHNYDARSMSPEVLYLRSFSTVKGPFLVFVSKVINSVSRIVVLVPRLDTWSGLCFSTNHR